MLGKQTQHSGEPSQRTAVQNLMDLLLRGDMAAQQQLVCIRVFAAVLADVQASRDVLLHRKLVSEIPYQPRSCVFHSRFTCIEWQTHSS